MTTRASRRIAAISLLFPVLLAGCEGDAPRPPTEDQLALREAAWRQACAARELDALATEDVETLEGTLQTLDPSDPIADISRRAANAALDFGRAFQRHAELRLRAYALMDSAVNVATSTADSARYIERAGAFSIRQPEAGTVEANVLQSYQERLQAILLDEDHRCNWDTPF